MNIGGLYQIKKWFWLLYPTKDIAEAATAAAASHSPVATARYWSKELNCNVSFFSQNSMFMLLEQTDKFCKILTTNGEIGWILYPEDAEWSQVALRK